MHWLIVESDKYHEVVLNRNFQVAFSGWKAGNRIGIGKWDLYLVNEGSYELILGDFYYRGYESGWNTIETLEWINIDLEEDILKFGLQIRFTEDRLSLNVYPKGWKFKIFIKTKEESGEGHREAEEFIPDVEFCSDSIATEGPDKILGAICPIDPSTKKSMSECLNWRRRDQIGRKCRAIMDNQDRVESIKVYCKLAGIPDCKCIDKFLDPEYQKELKADREDDHCWYFPCASGAFLTYDEGKKISCNANICEVAYNADHTGGNVDIYKNSANIKCFNVELPTPGEDSSKETIVNKPLDKRDTFEGNIFVILTILFFLFILLKS